MRTVLDDFYRRYHSLFSFKLCIGELPAENEEIKPVGRSQICQAAKAASLQSEHAAQLYLAALGEAVWDEGLDLSSLEVCLTLPAG